MCLRWNWWGGSEVHMSHYFSLSSHSHSSLRANKAFCHLALVHHPICLKALSAMIFYFSTLQYGSHQSNMACICWNVISVNEKHNFISFEQFWMLIYYIGQPNLISTFTLPLFVSSNLAIINCNHLPQLQSNSCLMYLH